jgi:hypothetical protein
MILVYCLLNGEISRPNARNVAIQAFWSSEEALLDSTRTEE